MKFADFFEGQIITTDTCTVTEEEIIAFAKQYDPQWFQLDGPRRLTFMTCTDLKKGEFRKTAVVIASPVR